MKRYITGFLCVVLGILIDQYTKFLAVTQLKTNPISIIDGVFELHYLENRGAAFGILQNQQIFFLIITVIMLIAIVFLYVRLPYTKRVLPLRICLIFITSGAIGNMIDRVRLNYVIDFLYFELIDFPIFNVADIFVTVSTFVIALLILFYYSEDEFDTFIDCLKIKKSKTQESGNDSRD